MIRKYQPSAADCLTPSAFAMARTQEIHNSLQNLYQIYTTRSMSDFSYMEDVTRTNEAKLAMMMGDVDENGRKLYAEGVALYKFYKLRQPSQNQSCEELLNAFKEARRLLHDRLVMKVLRDMEWKFGVCAGPDYINHHMKVIEEGVLYHTKNLVAPYREWRSQLKNSCLQQFEEILPEPKRRRVRRRRRRSETDEARMTENV